MLGCTLVPYLLSKGHEAVASGRGEKAQYKADLNDFHAAGQLLERTQPEIVINLVGLTNVDHCEADPHMAYLSNVQTIENIVFHLNQRKSPFHLIHISTDQVYDNTRRSEEHQVRLMNYYAFSKYAGELAASHVPHTILRTNFFGRSRCSSRSSLTDWLYSSLLKKEQIQVIDDIFFTPLSMKAVAETIELACRKRPVGVFNLGSRNGMSKADFAYKFAAELNLPIQSMSRVPCERIAFFKAYRPRGMRMNCAKIDQILGCTRPSLVSEIKRVAKDYDKIS